MNPFKCYICGEVVPEHDGKRFKLATMSDDTDRAFIVHEECAEQLEDGTNTMSVRKSGR